MIQSTGDAGGDQAMADEPEPEPGSGTEAADWEWEDLSARHAGISLPHTLDLLKATVGDAARDAPVADVIKEVGDAIAADADARTSSPCGCHRPGR